MRKLKLCIGLFGRSSPGLMNLGELDQLLGLFRDSSIHPVGFHLEKFSWAEQVYPTKLKICQNMWKRRNIIDLTRICGSFSPISSITLMSSTSVVTFIISWTSNLCQCESTILVRNYSLQKFNWKHTFKDAFEKLFHENFHMVQEPSSTSSERPSCKYYMGETLDKLRVIVKKILWKIFGKKFENIPRFQRWSLSTKERTQHSVDSRYDEPFSWVCWCINRL